VHLDVDVIDAADAPALQYSVRGGPSLDALVDAAARLHATGRIAAVSVTTWDLARDADRATERVCLRVLDALIAGR
jgi:arginase family enzyme